MSLSSDIETLTGALPAHVTALHGGDLSDVYRVDLADGRRVVAKTGAHVAHEAQMLSEMSQAGARVPAVLAQSGRLMVLEHLAEVHPTPAAWASLGETLARLHATTGPHYGWPENYAFGTLPICNTPRTDWPGFWAEHRLLDGKDTLPRELVTRLEQLAGRLGDLLPRQPPPALLHGDLWTGNALFMEGAAALIDPACYYGHSEVDLAMLCLFGQPHPAFWEGYGPSDPDQDARRALYQLWPALVHLRLFGAGYLAMVEGLLNRVRG